MLVQLRRRCSSWRPPVCEQEQLQGLALMLFSTRQQQRSQMERAVQAKGLAHR
jgi:hypothetical protein